MPAPWGAGPSRSWGSAPRSTRSSSATSARRRPARWPPSRAAARRRRGSSTRATRRASRQAIAGCDAMVNATQHFWNLNVMHAAAAAPGVHYTDMGGLFHVTKQQVELRRGVPQGRRHRRHRHGRRPRRDQHPRQVRRRAPGHGRGGARAVRQRRRHRLERLRRLGPALLARDALRRVQRGRARVHRRALGRGHHRRRGAARCSTSASPPACSRPTTRSTPSRSPSGTRGRTRACEAPPSSSRCRPSSRTRCGS